MGTEERQFNNEAKEVVKEFVIKKMILLLAEPECAQKVKEDKEVLQKLGLQLTPHDLQPLLTAMRESAAIDHEGKHIRDVQRLQGYFAILSDFFAETPMWAYYNKFTGVKLGNGNLADFQYVTTALKILDHENWNNSSLNGETQQQIKILYLHTVLDPRLSGEDKVANLNILQHDLKIALSEQEKTELSKYLKLGVMGMVELIDQMRKTSFGAQPLPESESNASGAAISFPFLTASPGTRKKKGFLGFLGKK